MRVLVSCLVVAALAVAATGGGADEASGAFALTSPAFAGGGEIPRRYTCEGRDVSPPLAWRGAPEGTKSFALVVTDPDAPDPAAPRTPWVHWVVVDLPLSARGLPEDAGAGDLPGGARHGTNDWKRRGYGGPCPPVGRHRYVHVLYALDAKLPALEAPTRAELERAMAGHVLGRAELVGTYAKRAAEGRNP